MPSTQSTSRARARRSTAVLAPSSPIAPKENDAATPLSPPRSGRLRPRGNASVTPKRLARFFTPRSSVAGSSEGGRKRPVEETEEEALQRSTRRRLFPLREVEGAEMVKEEEEEKLPVPKGVRDDDEMDWSVAMSSPFMRHSRMAIDSDIDDMTLYPSSPIKVPYRPAEPPRTTPVAPIKRLFKRNHFATRLMFSEMGYPVDMGFSIPEHSAFLASLASTANDTYHLHDLSPSQCTVVPFSLTTATLRGRSCAVIGDSSGTVQFLHNSPGKNPAVQAFWKAHENAITAMDVCGQYLATASSDRTSRVTDIETGTTILNLAPHDSALRNIKFRPSDPHILMTSSRDGTVNIWDIRHRIPASTYEEMEQTLWSPPSGLQQQVTPWFDSTQIRYCKPVNSMVVMASKAPRSANSTSRASVTALQWLPGREHMFLAAGEANASITLWDSRYISGKNLAAVSRTALPENDAFYSRDFGVTSMSLSGDGTRLYSTCRNSSVYAYSLPHLILGEAPEFDEAASKFAIRGQNKTGLGPLYSMRDPDLRIDSFWIKGSVSQPKDSPQELLAVGNTGTHPIVFHLDEKLMASQIGTAVMKPAEEKYTRHLETHDYTLPCFTHGVALRSGLPGRSATETTSVAWTADDSLVTVDDESNVRFWKQDAVNADMVRATEEDDPVRFSFGWADVPREEFDGGMVVDDFAMDVVINY